MSIILLVLFDEKKKLFQVYGNVNIAVLPKHSVILIYILMFLNDRLFPYRCILLAVAETAIIQRGGQYEM